MGLTGHVEEIKKNQHYRLVVNLEKDESGPKTKYPKKRKDVRCGGKREAESLLKEWIDELEQPPAKSFSETPTGDFLLHWVDTIAKPNLERNTYEGYRWRIEEHLKPSIGHIPLCELTPMHIQTLYSYKLEVGRLENEKARGKETSATKKAKSKKTDKKEDKPKGLSNRSVEFLHTILNQALNVAVDLELIPKNPCVKIKPPKNRKSQKEKMVVLASKELRNFLSRITDHDDYAEIYTDAYTGMRISELLALQWSDILWDQKKINIDKTIHKLANGEFELRPRTKNKKPRVIDVTDSVLYVLKQHRKQQMTAGTLNNEYNLVFPDNNKFKGMPQDRKNLYHRFVNVASKMGHKGMRFHDLRHTHATILLEAGEMPNAVAERLGHDVNTLLKTYAHVLPSAARKIADRFEELMNS